MINALTIDVEDYFHVSALAPAIPRERWNDMPSRVDRNVDLLLQTFADADVRATFFILGWVADRSGAVVKRIADAGHEIACHGYSHQVIYKQTESVFREETFRSKRLLEDLTGRTIKGYRAASFSITRKSLWALDTLIDAGFEYDSSIFPIRHDRYGIADFSPKPLKIRAPSGREIVEFPMSVANWFGVRLPVSGGGYFRIFPYLLTRLSLRRINTVEKRPFVFYLHPWEIDPAQPRVNAGWLSTFRHYRNLDKCHERLIRMLGEFRFGTIEDTLAECGLLQIQQRNDTCVQP